MKKYFNLIPILFVFIFCINALASQTKETVKISINGTESNIRVLNHDYDKNMYIPTRHSLLNGQARTVRPASY